ncbi:MAG: uroporphyrinogen decarboxylase family protein [Acidobacteria bacterium]|nr:uroporphyrinogen decarboxylase family protein [Acidobacteriota bacterium]
MTGRERVLATIEGRPADHLAFMPITMMFAARFAGVNYSEYARNHAVMAAAQVQTAEAFDFDYVSSISDPAREASDFGAEVEWFDDQPPAIIETRALLAEKSTLRRLKPLEPSLGPRMSDRILAVELLRKQAGQDRFVEGWVEGPCAEAADLRGINTLMLDFFDDTEFVRDLFELVVENAIGFALAQIRAGADIIGIGDAAASLIGPRPYYDQVWAYERKLVDAIHAAGGRARLHICGNTRRILEGMGTLGCDIVDLDFLVPLDAARREMGPGQVLLGNLDPVKTLSNGTPESVRAAVAECHRQAGSRYVVSAGCEVARDTPHENLRALGDYARNAN